MRTTKDRPGFREEKICRYLDWGAPIVLDVDPKGRAIVVHTETGQRRLERADRFEDSVVPWLAFEVSEIFDRLDRLGL